MIRKNVAFLILLLFFAPYKSLASQVFEVSVDVNTAQISTTDYDYIDELGPLIKEYLETNSWSEIRYEEFERIRMNIQIVINSVEDRLFSATILFSTERPIYNTIQVSPLIVISDNHWRFQFARGQNLLFDTYQYDPIASILDFYAYTLLGFDRDSFSEKGGEEYFRRAERISDMGQSSGFGWSGTGSRRHRSDLISQLLNPNYEEFRKAVYYYHRHGLDLFIQDPSASRENVLKAFNLIHESQRKTTARYLFDLLFTAKHREFRAIFMDADTQERLEAYHILTTIDDSRISEYERLQ